MDSTKISISVRLTSTLLLFCGLILFFISVLHLFGPSADSQAYADFLHGNEINNPPAEIGADLIKKVARGNEFIFFGIFAMLGISFKLIGILRYSKFVGLSVILYFLTYYFLHDYTQIRAGVASGIFLLSIGNLVERKTFSYFFKAMMAIVFHYSALIMLPIYFVIKYVNSAAFKYLPAIGIALVVLKIDLSKILLSILSYNEFIYNLFLMKRGYGEDIAVFNLISLSFVFVFYFISIIELKLDRVDHTLYKILSISLFVFFSFSSLKMPVITFRMYEFLNIVIVILMANIIAYINEKNLAVLGLLLYFSLHIYHLLFNVRILPNLSL
jgi:hypothetical protein